MFSCRSYHHPRRLWSIIPPVQKYSTQIQKIFGDAKSAEFIAGAASAANFPKSYGLPEVIVTGRANVGKSSLFNAVLGRSSLLHTSKKAGRTRQLNFYRVGAQPGKLILIDAPGYGARGRPEWGEMFDEYLQTRKELRRVYILFNGKHGLNDFDRQMLARLSDLLITPRGMQPWTIQSVITKADTIPTSEMHTAIASIRKQIQEAAPMCLPPIITSIEMSPAFGIDEVRQNIVEACGTGRVPLYRNGLTLYHSDKQVVYKPEMAFTLDADQLRTPPPPINFAGHKS